MTASTPDQPFDRATMRTRLTERTFDVVVIGGGVTGLGVALDAATRGLSTALVERDDFASGTSSKSSKLVHGGLRYLQQGDVRLVYEALLERQRLRRNARHLVDVLPFMIPILTRDGVVSRTVARALGSALWMYDVTGGLRIGRIHRRLNRSKALSHFPTMRSEKLASAYVYFDAQADDARLCLALARTAADAGAVVVNRVEVTGVSRDSAHEQFTVHVCDADGTFAIKCRSIVNATGVWVDRVLGLNSSPHTTMTHRDSIRPAKGVHVTLPWHLVKNDIAVVIPVPKDRRSLFLVPWGPLSDGTFTHTFVGTTDTEYSGSLDDPQCTKDDVEYILRAVNNAISTQVTAGDVVGSWAGLRPLVAPSDGDASMTSTRTADLSRRHRVSVSPPGLVTVTGGKLTTYRAMAQDAVDALGPILGIRTGRWSRHRCRTRTWRIHGSGRRRPLPVEPSVAQHLWSRYGTDSTFVADLITADPALAEPLVPGLAYLRAEVVWAVRHEMATTLDDVLARRTRAILFDRRGALEAAPEVARLMARVLGWDETRTRSEIDKFTSLCDHEAVCNELSEASIGSVDQHIPEHGFSGSTDR